MLHVGLNFVAPVIIKVFINYVSVEDDQKSVAVGLLYVALFFLAPTAQSVAAAHFNIWSRRLGFCIQGGTACMVFEKVNLVADHGRFKSTIRYFAFVDLVYSIYIWCP